MATNAVFEERQEVEDESENESKESQPQYSTAECSQIGTSKTSLTVELYGEQLKSWPKEGKHILSQYDDNNVVVYQAFKPSICEYAVKNQRFGGPDYSFSRMSWIKTNFLWMMYRCGWCQKKNQERVLALTITRQGFEYILAHAYTIQLQKAKKISTDNIQVRLQWDPDHTPSGGKTGGRRAIQLGLKGEMLSRFSSEFLVKVKDITDYVHEQYEILKTEGQWKIHTPRERVYRLQNEEIAPRIDLDYYDHTGPKLIVS